MPRSQLAPTISGARFDSPTFGAAAENADLQSLGLHPMQGMRSPNGGEIGSIIFRPFRDIDPSTEGLTAQPHIFGGGLVDFEHNPESLMV